MILCACCVHGRALDIGPSLWLQGHTCHYKLHCYLWTFFLSFLGAIVEIQTGSERRQRGWHEAEMAGWNSAKDVCHCEVRILTLSY